MTEKEMDAKVDHLVSLIDAFVEAAILGDQTGKEKAKEDLETALAKLYRL